MDEGFYNLIASPSRLALVSPQIALAVVEGVQLAPMVLACRATFTTPGQGIPAVALENGQGATIAQSSIVAGCTYQIDQPNLNAGNFLKSVNDYAYGEQSGIQARMNVVGSPRFVIAEFYEPVRILRGMINRRIQSGWCFNGTQSIIMAFQTDTTITPPTSLTFAFEMWQPAGTDRYNFMSERDAIAALVGYGVELPTYMAKRYQ